MRTEIKVFLTLILAYALFTHTYLTTNDASRFSLTASVVEDHSFEIGSHLNRTISDMWIPKDFAVFEGKVYSDKAPLGSFLGVLPYFFTKIFTGRLDFLVFFTTVFSSGSLTALTSVLLYRLGYEFGEDEGKRVFVALGYGLGSMAFFYGTVFFSHGITTFLIVASFYLLVKSDGSWKSLILSGFLAGLSVSSDYQAVLILLPLTGYVFWKIRMKGLYFLSGLVLGALPLLFYQFLLFGDPFIPTYSYSALYLTYHAKGFFGIETPTPGLIKNLVRMLLGPWGFFMVNPLIFLALAGFPVFWRKHRAVTMLTIIAFIGLAYLEGALGYLDAYSARFMLPVLPFLYLWIYGVDINSKTFQVVILLLSIIALAITLTGLDIFLAKDPGNIPMGRVNMERIGIILISYIIIWNKDIIRFRSHG